VQGLKPNTVGPLLSCAYSKPVACNIGLIHAISHLGGIRWYNLLLNGKKKNLTHPAPFEYCTERHDPLQWLLTSG